jgi:RNA polymerase sigma-70 factor (ECF subfamily)
LEQIISDCKKNKRKAQVALYNHYAPLLLGVCSRYVHDKSEAQDILQDGFLKIFRNIKEYSGQGHFENWMKRIMINTAITHFHREKKHYYHDELEDVNEVEVVVDVSPQKEFEAKELYEMLKEMPEGYRVIFNLYAVEGYKHKEIAEKLDIEESTSKSQYLRAKKWLIKEMKNQDWIE